MKNRKKISRATIKDIAKKAKVSPTTVSLTMKDQESRRVSPQTRKRILKIAKRLDYRPNYAARALIRSESSTIGLVITTLDNPLYAELAQDIITRAKEIGYSVIISSVLRGIEDEKRSVHDLIDRGVDGLIISSAVRDDPMIADLIKENIPFVLMLRNVRRNPVDPPLDYVGVDNERGGYLAVEHLLRMGHKRIALLTGNLQTSTGHDRLMGALAAFRAYGVKYHRDLVLNGDFQRKTGGVLTRQLLTKKKKPTAIFAHSDHMAIGVIETLMEEGLKVPEHVAVVGFDDIEMAGIPGVDLTTVSQKKATMGRTAVDVLIEKIKGRSSQLAKLITLDPILIIRNSCGLGLRGGKYELPSQ